MSHPPQTVIPDRSRLSGPPPPINTANTSQAPPGYNQGTMPPMGALYRKYLRLIHSMVAV